MKRITTPSVATGIAVTSLFVALGGPAQAASLITGSGIKNSTVTGADIKNNGLTGLDVKDIRSGDVRDGALQKKDFKAGELPAGATGAKGEKGDKGDAGPSRWLLVDRNGKIEAQSGGFRLANAYPAGGPGEGNVYIESGDKDLSNNGIVATIALENQYSLKGDGLPADANIDGRRVNGRNSGADANPEFSGEITATRCAITGVVACAPADTAANGGDGQSANRPNYFVVSPRNSDGSFTKNDSAPNAGDNDHKRFYVIISGPQD